MSPSRLERLLLSAGEDDLELGSEAGKNSVRSGETFATFSNREAGKISS
jgi:hypothetical protein